ncbi:trypsin alpha [Drosophila teissieri]|uniref:trypsin alpha n=1 Tax=Drosophila teissieri TaxID=7243 RepID=UPI001CBA1EED|nr:trypsin alpha [Drosophila teissieri]
MLFQGLLLLVSIAQIAADFESIGIGKAPWQASVQINGKHHCGGVIYSEYIVLTIAECVRKASLEIITVRVGATEKSSGGDVQKVKKMRLQVLGMRRSDVAILQLRYSLYLDQDIQAIPLASFPLLPGTNATVTGWGHVSALKHTTEVLLRVDVRSQNRLSCAAEHALHGRLVNVDEVCAVPAGKVPYVCQGFVGAPLVADNTLYGLLSWESACDVITNSSLYANIPVLKVWIDSTVKLMSIF